MSVRVAIGALCALAIFSTSVRAATDPERRWVTLRSPHFAVHTYDGGQELARQVAAYAEEAWKTLNPVLGWEPSETVHIRLVDDSDSSNGLASVMPYPVITIWAHPPPMDSDLADHTDWMRLLIFHEYAHIAHLDHATGIPRVLNRVFGKVIKPNAALPRWLTEGIATWAESRHSPRGRLDSSRYRMMMRMAVLEQQAPSLAELTGKPLRPPRGDAWYLYGGHLVDQMVRDAGP
ncbi:MAG: hypothetical protein VX938_02290, partial [Myxococcota bacterium]|nr:hypothetical protein [Myxococcota bacterium]